MAIDYLNYGVQDTRTFCEVFPSDEEFADWYEHCGLPQRLRTGEDYANYGIKTIYALLISNYANDHIASYDENRFKFQVMQIIYEAGPAWQRAMVIQDKLLDMSDEQIHKGSHMDSTNKGLWSHFDKTINNHAEHPDTEPSDTTITELPYISDQRVQNNNGQSSADGEQHTTWTKDNVKGLIELLYSLDDTLVSRFLLRFKKLFIKIVIDNKPPIVFGTENY